VITSGGYAVPDGTKIKIEKPGAADKESADKGDKDDDKKDAKDDPGEGRKDKKAGDAAKPAGKGKE